MIEPVLPSMAAENHPMHKEWLTALKRMIAAEKRYFNAVAEGQTAEEAKAAQQKLHRARQAFWDIADNLDGPALQ
jgi:hypothetical protein